MSEINENEPIAQLVKTKKWIVELQYFSDGSSKMIRTNDGFNPLEILGICTKAQLEILAQISGEIKPTVVERNVIKDKSE